MSGRVKLIVALVAAGAGIGIYFATRGGADANEGAQDDGAKEVAGAQPERDLPTTPRRPGARVGSGSASTDPIGPADRAPSDPEVYEMEDGTRVADHRKDPQPYLRPGVPHRSRSSVDAKVSTAVLRQVRPIVLRCLDGIPADAYGTGAIVMARAVIAIDEQGNFTATELGADGTDIEAARLEPALACIKNAASSVQGHVDHAAVASARLAFPIRPLDYLR